MNIRLFEPGDAEFCFKVRAAAFIQEFYNEIGAAAVTAGVNRFMPNDYIKMAENAPFFVIERDVKRLGFFTIKKYSEQKAEIPLIYIDLNEVKSGLGSSAIRFVEIWVMKHWPDVTRLIVNTIVPQYNGGFYEKAGFIPRGESVCRLSDMDVKAMCFEKKLVKKAE